MGGKINGGNSRRKVSNQKRKDSPILEEPKKDFKIQKISDDSNNEENTSATHEPKRKSVKDHARYFDQKFDRSYDNSQSTNSSNKVELPEGKRKSVKEHARTFNQKFDHPYNNSQSTNSWNKVEMPDGPSFQERLQHFQSEETTFDFSSDNSSSAISGNALSESELL